MIEIEGLHANAKVYADIVEEDAIKQIKNLLNHSAFKNSNIRIMPDVHVGAGCVIGFTAKLTGKVVPNLIGVDIGCGVNAVNLGNIKIDFEKLDRGIRREIPFGFERNKEIDTTLSDDFISRVDKVCRSLDLKFNEQIKGCGSLGGGNHFIEIDIAENGDKWVVVHSGSRNFGLQVATHHQKKAFQYCDKKRAENDLYKVDKGLSFLEDDLLNEYIHDLKVAQEFAINNRRIMIERLMKILKSEEIKDEVISVHNYINFDDNIIRKGAISAHEGERLIIPLNMKDGNIIATGKGNPEWNFSAPHGAGRVLSRTKAKQILKMDDFKSEMKGIWSSCIEKDTIDESPMAYKPPKMIIKAIRDTVEIEKTIKPVYNFKASEE